MPLIPSNRLLFLAPRRRRYEDVETIPLDLPLDDPTAPSRRLAAGAGALVEDIDQVIALEDRPTPLGSDLAFEAEVAELTDSTNLLGLPSVSLVIPTLNEEANIGWVLQRVPAWVEEVIVVDGGSKDRTVEVARTLRPDVVVVTELRKGKGVALRTGFARATRDVIVMLDADGSMDPQEMGRFIELLDNGHDLVKGSRFLQGGGTADMSVLRETGNRCLLAIANLLFGTGHTDLCYGYAAFRRHAILALEVTADGFEVETELFLRATRNGLTVGEVPSFEAPRRTGASNLHTFRDGWRVLRTIVAERRRPVGPATEVPAGTLEILVEPEVAEPQPVTVGGSGIRRQAID